MNDQWLPDLLNLWIIVYVKRSKEIPEAPPRWRETYSRNLTCNICDNSSCQKELRKTICWRETLAAILFANHNGERSFSGQTAPSVVLRLNHPFVFVVVPWDTGRPIICMDSFFIFWTLIWRETTFPLQNQSPWLEEIYFMKDEILRQKSRSATACLDTSAGQDYFVSQNQCEF